MNIGYACINLTLDERGVTTNRGMIKRTWEERGIQYASKLALQNVVGLLAILDWNVAHGIKVFRITSELFPWASEYRYQDLPDFPEIRATLEECGKRDVRLSTHPGPFNKLASDGPTLENTIVDLELHSELFDLMGLTPSHWNKINIHVGGAYGDKPATLKRFAQNFSLLSEGLRKRLTVENDDKPGVFSVRELLPLHEEIGIPIVFDYFHHRCYDGGWTEEQAFLAAYDTWDVKPVFHYSSSKREREEATAKREAHSDWVYERIPTYGKDIDIMLETKLKELSVGQYAEKFGVGVERTDNAVPAIIPKGFLQQRAAEGKLAEKKAADKRAATEARQEEAARKKAADKKAREKKRTAEKRKAEKTKEADKAAKLATRQSRAPRVAKASSNDSAEGITPSSADAPGE